MSNAYAENELERLEKECDSEDGLKMQEEVTKCILELLDVFEKQDHSGASASYIINLLKRLVQHKPLSPLTGKDDEWESVGGDMEQNKRCFTLFRTNHDNSTAYTIEGVVFSSDGGATWFTSGWLEKRYREPIVFPWMPPDRPREVYVKEVHGDTGSDYVDITGNEEEIKRLRAEYEAQLAEMEGAEKDAKK